MNRNATFALEEANTYTITGPTTIKLAAAPRRPSAGSRQSRAPSTSMNAPTPKVESDEMTPAALEIFA